MNLYLWEESCNFHIAFAPDLETAKTLIRSQLPNHQSYIESVLKDDPKVYNNPKSFTIWADISDFYESK